MSNERTRFAARVLRGLCLSLCVLFVSTRADAQPEPTLVPPELLESTPPAWPEDLHVDVHESVVVVLELTVDEQGNARDAVVLTSASADPACGDACAALDALALASAQTLRFAPATRDGVPIAARIPFRFTFTPLPPPEPAPEPEPVPVVEAEPEPEPVVAEGLTLEVRGEKPPREPTVHRIEAEDARKIPGTGGDALRAIETMPGVGRPPVINGELIVRGSGPLDSAYFIEGVTVPLAYHFGGITSVVPTEALEKLDFRPGNFGPEYGRAMGGIVDIGLRSPRRDRFGGLVQLDAIDGRMMVEGPLGKNTRMLIGARRSWVDAWVGKVDSSVRSAPVYYDGQALIEHDFSKRTRARLIFFGADDRVAALFSSPSAHDPAEGGRASMAISFTRLALRIDSELTDKLQLAQTLSWGTDIMDLVFGSEYSDVFVHSLQDRTELRLRASERLTAVVGLDVMWMHWDVHMRVPAYPSSDGVEGPYFARPRNRFDEQVSSFRPAVYGMLELVPTRNLRIVPGLRADYVQETGDVTLDPRLSTRFDVRPTYPRTTLKGAVGLHHQPPPPEAGIAPFGTPGVRSNRSVHSSAGFEQELLPDFTFSAEGFYKHFDDLLVARPAEDDTLLGARFVNTGSGRAFGGEFLLRYRPASSRFFGWVAYTLSRSERKNADGEPYALAAWDQTHILSALGSVALGRGFTLGARFRYVTGLPYTPYVGGVLDLDAGAYAPIPAATHSARLGDFHQLDLRLDKTWEVSIVKLSAYLELRNAYNRTNPEDRSYSYDYAQSKDLGGLPLLPVIGLRGEL